jgi:hypothetical protein
MYWDMPENLEHLNPVDAWKHGRESGIRACEDRGGAIGAVVLIGLSGIVWGVVGVFGTLILLGLWG